MTNQISRHADAYTVGKMFEQVSISLSFPSNLMTKSRNFF